MSDWLNSFLSNLDKETVTVLGTGFAAAVVALVAGLRGIKRGQPTSAALTDTANAITKMSCGAPELTPLLRKMLANQQEQNLRQIEMAGDIQRMGEKITRIEDRTHR
ncbi:hypothetical protein BOO69_08335 [Sulfitobacter alexandrii]|uniref:Uncharacterized protein n=1 Tax=Sulfitobacter alexandrii TaxID=1917485 RepID=A0A1J0WGW2_9RHOB|nr:hypothetical protein [Sulfitobacter alexandrii]APE43424.1 hypothetical protein BOO69_08335 [Sulfitobacter alexandrii]